MEYMNWWFASALVPFALWVGFRRMDGPSQTGRIIFVAAAFLAFWPALETIRLLVTGRYNMSFAAVLWIAAGVMTAVRCEWEWRRGDRDIDRWTLSPWDFFGPMTWACTLLLLAAACVHAG